MFSAAYYPQANGCIERFNGTLTRMIYRHFTQYETKKWNDVLPLFIDNYNHAKHSATGYTPDRLQQAVINSETEVLDRAREKIQKGATRMVKQPKTLLPIVDIGDHVRISAHTMADERKQTFRKGYLANWSQDLYVVERISTPSNEWHKPQYRLKDQTGHSLRQRFYRPDLQLVDTTALTINHHSRPDYSEGKIFNQEEHARGLSARRPGPVSRVPLPPMQGDERKQQEPRAIRPRRRLIDELVQR